MLFTTKLQCEGLNHAFHLNHSPLMSEDGHAQVTNFLGRQSLLQNPPSGLIYSPEIEHPTWLLDSDSFQLRSGLAACLMYPRWIEYFLTCFPSLLCQAL